MLTALEVHGFKSFADKTRFDFPAGITVVVGPNGSGKSNVVDALKWVLGTQSPKSLRGSEMTDVIFKGSSAGRKPLNTAEASIVFDNHDGRLPTEEKQVRVTRRVYRSGEGEYLINNQPCRLKDIKDLFRGTGIGTDAYSIIEQGKVSAMLQASAKDRRAIFEEAAGISRFKAKKIETERRLTRVDQNMLRLSDIVDEVESRLKSVRSQAGKARRYKEYSDRLQQLRTQVGHGDWRKLSERLIEIEAQLGELQTELTTGETECGRLQSEMEATETGFRQIDEAIRETQSRTAGNRERIAAGQSTIEHQRTRCLEIEEEISRCRRQLAAMSHRTGDLDEQLRETATEVDAADDEYEKLSQRVDAIAQESDRLSEQLEASRGREDALRGESMTLVQQAAEWANALSAGQSQLGDADAAIERRRGELNAMSIELEKQVQVVADAESLQRSLESNAGQHQRQVDTAEDDAQRMQRLLDRRREELTTLKSEQVRLQERAALLGDLVKRQEGVRSGTQEVLSRAKSATAELNDPYTDVCGMLADLIEVHVESAEIVEAALGEMAQAIVVRGRQLQYYYRDRQRRPKGRVALLPLEDAPLSIEASWDTLEQQPGVIGRADRFVHTELIYTPLVRRILGNTWVVETLDVAEKLSELAGEQARFVTLDGAVVESDGTLVFGAGQQATGLISRRSELRQVNGRLESFAGEIETARNRVAQAEAQVEEATQQVKQLMQLQRELADEFAGQRATVAACQQELARGQTQLTTLEAELTSVNQARQRALAKIAEAERQQQSVRTASATCDEKLAAISVDFQRLAAQHKACDLRATSAKIDAAKSEERLDAQRAKLRQLQRDRQERRRALDELKLQINTERGRLQETELSILNAESANAMLYLDREQRAAEMAIHAERREALNAERREITRQLEAARKTVHRLEEKRHRLEMAAEQARGEREHLAQRLRDDYGIDLATMAEEESEEQSSERESVEEEIEDLRRKINNIGAVNLEALNEIEELEQRFNELSGQFNDLRDSKLALEKIIQRINADSRRLFAETLEAIRLNFQQLYRKLFGGGFADLVLEEGVDILEAGIEIVANPPGKPAFNNSLLSGGEQGLTAVSLLLAIFQHRPSPFCVLDEVDAPLDESNIGRFVDVLRGFLDWTKFVIVTHSKKTMTAANTLYGITMQEPNVSKRVSVRFDDVSDQGEISDEAVAREEASGDDGDERGAA